MSTTVEIYLADSARPVALAQRVAVAIETAGCFTPGGEFHFRLDASEWVGVEGVGSLTLAPTEHDPFEWYDNAFAPYNYELSLECPPAARLRSLERFGRAVFDQLVSLDRPMALGDGRVIFADHLPGRRTRGFGAGADVTGDGQDRWYEPRLYGDIVPPPEPIRWPALGAGRATVFEAGGLLHLVPVYQGFGRAERHVAFPVAPVLSMRASAPADELAMALSVTLDRSTEPYPAMHVDTASWITALAGCPAPEYSALAVSLDVELAEQAISMSPRLPSTAAGCAVSGIVQGPWVPALAVRMAAPWSPAGIAERVFSLLAAARGAAARPPVDGG